MADEMNGQEIAQRLDDLTRTIRGQSATLTLRFDAVDARLDTIGRRLDAMDGRFDAIDRRLDAMDGRFDGMDRRLDAMDGRFDGMDRRLDAMDRRFDAIDHRLDAVDGRLGSIDGRLDRVDVRLVRIETKADMALEAFDVGRRRVCTSTVPSGNPQARLVAWVMRPSPGRARKRSASAPSAQAGALTE